VALDAAPYWLCFQREAAPATTKLGLLLRIGAVLLRITAVLVLLVVSAAGLWLMLFGVFDLIKPETFYTGDSPRAGAVITVLGLFLTSIVAAIVYRRWRKSSDRRSALLFRMSAVLALLVVGTVGLYLTTVGVVALIRAGRGGPGDGATSGVRWVTYDDADSARSVGEWMTSLGLFLTLAVMVIVYRRMWRSS